MCRKGLHERTPETTYTRPDGRIQCRPCKIAANARYLSSEKAVPALRRKDHRYDYSTLGMLRQARRQLHVAEEAL